MKKTYIKKTTTTALVLPKSTKKHGCPGAPMRYADQVVMVQKLAEQETKLAQELAKAEVEFEKKTQKTN